MASKQTELLSILLVAVSLACATTASALAQSYPQRPVRLIVPLSPGGGVDTIARLLARHYGSVWAQPFVVDNRAGAGGTIGVDLVVKAAPDGHTLLVSSSGIITNAATRPAGTRGYDPTRDLEAVTQLVSTPYLVAVSAASPFTDLRQLIGAAQKKPDAISYASAGVGGITHMAAELLRSQAGVAMTHVPFRGIADAYPAVATGQINWVLGNPISVMPLVAAGRLRAIATTSLKRVRSLPDIPTVTESGVPGYEVVGWFGVTAPAGTPRPVLNLLYEQAAKAMQDPEVVRRMEREGSEIVLSPPDVFKKAIRAEYEMWRKLASSMVRE
jgi:tripartite-type tricarboxylate transporter receptor subunit TctC